MATELAKAYVQIIPSAQGISGSISQAIGGEATSAGKSAGLNIVGAIKGVIAAAGIGTAIKQTLDAGGALQQSFGGLDTIYGEASAAAKEYAATAAQAGISANDYAEQAVSFGAALKQAYEGDTVKAVEAANTAILDMADNSAKMGTDIGMIQNAYQGFAKQNYTMLDNLKLGYGGTKKEMERLLEDATALSGVEYDMDNLGDVYDAIHVIQQDLGLTGVAAAEASDTFTGSMGAMKAAAQNLMANLALGEDITTPLQVLVGNARVFLTNNLLPMIMNILKGIPVLIREVVNTFIPELIKDGAQFAKELGNGLVTGIPEFMSQALEFLTEMSANLRAESSKLVDIGIVFLKRVAEGIAQGLPELITTLPGIINNFAGIINDNLPRLWAAGWGIIKTLAQGIVDGLPEIMAAIPQILEAIFNVWRAGNIFQIGVDTIGDIIDGILDALPGLLQAAGTIIGELLKGIISNLPQILESGVKLIMYLIAGLIRAIPQIYMAIPTVINAIVDTFKGFDWKKIGIDILIGIKNGILGALDYVVDAAKEAAGAIWEAVKGFFQIGSPSKLMAYAGEMLDLGLAGGIADNQGLVKDAVDGLNTSLTSSINPRYDFGNNSNDVSALISLLNTYLPQIASGENQKIVLEGDAGRLFRLMQRESVRNTQLVGVNSVLSAN